MSDQISSPSLTQFGHTVHASPEDTDRCEREGHEESLEAPTLTKASKVGVLVKGGVAKGPVSGVGPARKVQAEKDKDEQGENLDTETNDHDIVTNLRVLVLVRGSRSNTTSCCLKEERSKIARNKLKAMSARMPPRILPCDPNRPYETEGNIWVNSQFSYKPPA